MIKLQKKYWASTIGLSLFAILVIYALINEWCIEKNIEDNKYITITKAVDAIERRSTNRLYYNYNYNYNIIKSSERLQYDNIERFVGK